MNRTVLALLGLFLILFAAVTWVRSRREEGSETRATSQDADRIRGFWDAYRRATAARTEGDWDAAVSAYRDALEYDSTHQDSVFFLAVSLEELGRYREAVALLKGLTELYPEHGRGFSHLGSLLALRAPGAVHDLEAAESAFLRSQEINQEHSGPFLSRGRLALEEGRYEDARRLFDIAADMGAPLGAFYAGLTEFLVGHDESALAYFDRVLASFSKEKTISGRGATAEGDARATALTPLERAHVLSQAFARWTAKRMRSEELSGARYALMFESPEEGRGAFVDYDQDGRLDLAVAGPSGVVLHRNTGGGWERHALDSGEAWDVLVLDLEGDGDQDLYVIGSGYLGVRNNRLYLREGTSFVDSTDTFGLGGARSTGDALARDFDGNGSLDLLEVGNANENESPVRLYLREGSRFVESASGWGLQLDADVVDATAADVEGDGDTDVFLLAWKRPGRLFLNGGDGFEDQTASAGLEGVGGDGMSATFLDFDRDGDPDLLVSALAPLEESVLRWLDPQPALGSRSRLFRNDSGRFTEITTSVGLDRSYGVVQATPADVDADGFLDVILALGGLEVDRLEPSVVLRNVKGQRFETFLYVPSEHAPRRALGASAADVDGDGRMDLFLGGVGLFRALGGAP